MITFFTDPYKGELINHAIARYIEYERGTLTKELAELFLSPKVTACLSFGNRIEELAANIGGKYSADYLIDNFTIFPYYKIFCTQKKYQTIYKYIKLGNTTDNINSSSIIQVNDSLKKSLVYCEKCIKEDTEKYGEVYLHREHYLCGANTCYKHKMPLLEYETIENIFKSPLGKFQLLGKSLNDKMCKEYYKISNIQMELAVKILNMNVDFYRKDLTNIYIAELKKINVIIGHNINYSMIYEMIKRIYGEIGLVILKPYLDSKDISKHLFLNSKNFIEPSIHLLFIIAVWNNAESFVQACIKYNYILKQKNTAQINPIRKVNPLKKQKRYTKNDISILSNNECSIKVVGTAHRYGNIIENILNEPWQCKDANCQNRISESTITYNSNKKQLRQYINCLCGCHYVISIDIEDMNTRVIMQNYSDKTNETILEQYVERGMGYRKIAEGLGIPTSYVKRYITKEKVTLHNSLKYKMLEVANDISEKEAVDYFWKNYLELIVDFPYTPRSIFLKYLWDEYTEITGYTGSLDKIIIDRHEKIISDSKQLVLDFRNKKRKSKTSIEKNKVLMRAISYLNIFAKDELYKIVLDLSNKVSDANIEQLLAYIRDECEKGNEVKREYLWHKYPREMRYFKEKYPKDFEAFLPNKNATKGMIGVNRRVEKSEIEKETDKYDKDAYYELLINNVGEDLRKIEPPIKITKTLIRKRLYGLRVSDLNKQRYPKAVAALDRVCETSLEFRVRVCKYVIDKMDFTGQYVSLNRIFLEAKIKDSKIRRCIKEEVIEHLEKKNINRTE